MPLFPLLLVGLLVGGTLWFASQPSPRPAQLPPPLPQPPTPRTQTSDFESMTGATLSSLPNLNPMLETEIVKVLSSPTGNPASIDLLARQLDQEGLSQVASLLRQKIADLQTAAAVSTGTMPTGTATRDMWVRAPHGLNVRQEPSTSSMSLGTVPFGRTVSVVEITPSGWARIKSQKSDRTAFVCHSCAEGGNPQGWLVEGPPPGAGTSGPAVAGVS